jgi:hypothetical protein
VFSREDRTLKDAFCPSLVSAASERHKLAIKITEMRKHAQDVNRVILPSSRRNDFTVCGLAQFSLQCLMSHLGRFSKAPRVARESYGRRTERPEKPDWGPSREARGVDFLYGIQSVTGALSANKRKVYGLWMKSDFSKAMERYVEVCKRRGQF